MGHLSLWHVCVCMWVCVCVVVVVIVSVLDRMVGESLTKRMASGPRTERGELKQPQVQRPWGGHVWVRLKNLGEAIVGGRE